MRKFIAAWLLTLLPFVAFESYDFDDATLDIARVKFAECALEFGRKDIFDAQIKKIKNPQNMSSGVRTAELKNKISESVLPPHSEIFKFLSESKRNDDKFLICGLAAAKCFTAGQAKNAALYMSMCDSILRVSNPTILEVAILEIVDRFAEIDAKQPQQAAVEFLFKLNYSHDMVLRLYKLCCRPYASEKLLKLLNDRDFCVKRKTFVKHIKRIPVFRKVDKYREDYFLKYFKYSGIEFAMSWKIQKWEDYRNPILAHIYYNCGKKEMYEKYRDKSISKAQLYEMRGAYFHYVEYAAKIFCMSGDTEIAVGLVKTLPCGHRRNLALKRLTRYLAADRIGFEAVLDSGLFD